MTEVWVWTNLLFNITPSVSAHNAYKIYSPRSLLLYLLGYGISSISLLGSWTHHWNCGKEVLGVALCTDGACVDDIDLSICGVDSVTGTSVDPQLAGSIAGKINLLFLIYWTLNLVWTW